MKSAGDITEADLLNAYEQADLAHLGISFEEAKSDHALHSSMVGMIRSARDRAAHAPLRGTGSLHLEYMTGDQL